MKLTCTRSSALARGLVGAALGLFALLGSGPHGRSSTATAQEAQGTQPTTTGRAGGTVRTGPSDVARAKQRAALLGHTGEVEPVRIDDADVGIVSAETAPQRRETKVERVASPLRRRSAAPDRTKEAKTLLGSNELEQRSATLMSCRHEVAADKGVGAEKVKAGKLLLRWTVLPDGTVKETDVVAQSSTDPALMECIERRMNAWRFDRAAGDAFRITQPLVF